MPQHNNENDNEEALKKRRLTFAHNCSGVGSMGRSWIDIVRTSRTAWKDTPGSTTKSASESDSGRSSAAGAVAGVPAGAPGSEG